MRKICRLVQFVNSEALHSIQMPSPHDQRAKRTRLFASPTNDNQLESSVARERSTAGFDPAILMHGTVCLIGQQSPAFRFVIDGAELLDNAH
jgi:hypothetical protein